MNSIGKVLICAAIPLLCLAVSGCGYHLGSVMHPQVKTIAIAPVKNETLEEMATPFMRQALSEQFELDNSLRVKTVDEADCVLYGMVTNIKTTAIGFDSTNNEQTYTPAEFSLEITFEFNVIIPGRSKSLINTRQVTGRASYQVAADNDIARRRGIQQACRDAAQKAVVYTVEAW
ncbi:MAG: LPS assembly lipoprotein LptE [Victivallales bacterium]